MTRGFRRVLAIGGALIGICMMMGGATAQESRTLPIAPPSPTVLPQPPQSPASSTGAALPSRVRTPLPPPPTEDYDQLDSLGLPPLSGPIKLSAGFQAPFEQPRAEDRLRALEQQNRLLMQQMQQLRRELLIEEAATKTIREARSANIPGQFGRPLQPGRDVVEGDGEELSRARVDLSQGVRFLSPDGKYRIEFHDLTQFEGRFFAQTGPGSASGSYLHDNFDIPRQRLYFAGQVDQNFDFYTVINRGYGTLDVLDSYVNFKFDRAFNIRVGRTKTPYTYEYYKIAEGDLIAPERSVFIGNLAPNRQLGVMAFGRLVDDRLEYAVGLFNGPHRSFQDFNNYKNPFFYVNTRPFLLGGSDLLRNLNFGGSVNFGRENDPLEPNGFRTANDETTTDSIDNVSPTFLRFNSNAIEKGGTAFWAGDMAWYYRSLTALAIYDGGYITYATTKADGIRVPYEGGSFALTYFLTGEEIVTRKEIEPLRNFNWRNPMEHPGAVELYSRIAYLNAGKSIFTSGLADPTLWSRNAMVLDNGVNWYLNRYVRIFLDWQFADFGSRINIGPDRFTKTTNMFWIRSQIYY